MQNTTFVKKLIAERIFRIGVQRLWQNADGTYYVSISNRTYHSSVQIPKDKVEAWKQALTR